MSETAVKMEDVSPIKKKLSFEIPWDEVKIELDSVYREVGKKAKIKGFRPGKIPRQVLEKYFKEHVEEETVSNIINKYYWQGLGERKMTPLSQPDVTQEGIKENTPFSFSISFEIEPQFEPQGYKGMELERENIKITDDDLTARLNQIKQMFATMEEVQADRAVVTGDFVTIDFEGSVDGESLKEMKADNYLLEVGSKRFIPGFEEQLVGMKKAATGEIKVTFPEDYQEKKFAGKEAVFKVEIKNIKEKKLPEIDENFIKNFDKYSSLDDLKNDVRKSLEEEGVKLTEGKLQNNIMEKLLTINDFEAPSSLVEKQIYYMMADTRKRMTQAGMDEKNATEFSFQMHDKYKEEAVKIVRSFLMLKKISEKESFAIADEDIESHIRDLAAKHGRDYDLLKKAYEKEDKRENLRSDLLQKKVFDFIEQNANIKDIEKIGMGVEVEK